MYSLQFPAISTDFSEDLLQLENREDHSLGLDESFQRFLTEETSRYALSRFHLTGIFSLALFTLLFKRFYK